MGYSSFQNKNRGNAPICSLYLQNKICSFWATKKDNGRRPIDILHCNPYATSGVSFWAFTRYSCTLKLFMSSPSPSSASSPLPTSSGFPPKESSSSLIPSEERLTSLCLASSIEASLSESSGTITLSVCVSTSSEDSPEPSLPSFFFCLGGGTHHLLFPLITFNLNKY